MKNFKFLSLILAMFITISFTACNNGVSEKALVATKDDNNVKITMSFAADGDTIVYCEQVGEISKKSLNDAQKKALKNTAKDAEKLFDSLSGSKYDFQEKDDMYIETIKIPLEGKALKEVIKKKIMPISNENATKLSLKQTKKILEEAGWTVK
ncbi:MAG: DUF1307 domain-containing protein [Eubacteriales bacterium]|nr:DUF1307 domain-containing protein [Eubacteriales bacterium]MDY3332620.1 DUF1307 domain-containing protein [Gallibacter sp.]